MSRIEDAGEKIGAARKDFARRALDLADLEAMTDAQAVLLVTKDTVWPEPDWAALVDSGLSKEQAAFAKVVRTRIASKPTARGGSEASEVRRNYVRTIGIVRDVLLKPIGLVSDLPGWLSNETHRSLQSVMSPVGSRCAPIVPGNTRTFPYVVGRTDRSKIRTMLDEGFPGAVPAWRRGLKLYQETAGTIVVYRGNDLVGRGFPDQGAALAAAESSYQPKPARKSASGLPPLPPPRPHLDALERNGPDHRDGRDVAADEFVETLGFRGVEFGNWLPQGERQRVLNEGWDAVHDLADVMGVEPRSISLGGSLAAAFGSRGSGRALAHYEPGLRVFNLTRLSGAGSLAHEFAHALDHWVGEQDPQPVSRFTIRSITGWDQPVKDIRPFVAYLGDDAADGFVNLMVRLRWVELSEDEIASQRAQSLRIAQRNVDEARRRLDAAILPKLQREITTILQDREAALALLQSDNYRSALKTHRPSDFIRNAAALDRGRKTPYYTNPTELFARSFECWVFDRLADSGRRNDYLVHGVEADRYANTGHLAYRGNPYPVEDREAINATFDRAMLSLHPILYPAARPEPRVPGYRP